MSDQSDTLELESVPRGAKLAVTVRLAGTPVYADTIDPANAKHRKAFIDGVRARCRRPPPRRSTPRC